MDPKSLSPRLESNRIILQKHDTVLAPLMYSLIDRDRDRLQEFLPWVPKMKSKHDELQYILSTHERWKEGTLFDFSIIKKDDQSFMGTIGVHTINWETRSCELGYWILSKHEGQGFITEAVRELEKHLFEKGFNRIEIRCDPRNIRSSRVPIACGYIFDGHFRQDSTHFGIARDTWVFSKLKENYQSTFVTDMTARDLEALLAIAKTLPEYFTEPNLKRLSIDLQNQKALVLRHEDRIQGFLSFFSRHGQAEVSAIIVAQEIRNQGFEKKLLSHLRERLRAQGCESLRLPPNLITHELQS